MKSFTPEAKCADHAFQMQPAGFSQLEEWGDSPSFPRIRSFPTPEKMLLPHRRLISRTK